jgi:hypothetical protein
MLILACEQGGSPAHPPEAQKKRARADSASSFHTIYTLGLIGPFDQAYLPQFLVQVGSACQMLAIRVALSTRSLVGLLLATPMAGHPAFSTRLTGLFARPLVCGPFLMRGLSALAGNLALLGAIHRCKSAVFLCHLDLLPRVLLQPTEARCGTRFAAPRVAILCNGCATVGQRSSGGAIHAWTRPPDWRSVD